MADDLTIVNSSEGVMEVYTHPEVYPTITDDSSPPVEEFGLHLHHKHDYLVGWVDGKPIGVFSVHPENAITLTVHVQVIPEYREKYADEFGKRVIAWVFENTEWRKMRATIATLYPNVMKFAEKMGFKKEGVSTDSFMKDGKVYDIHYYGIDRAGWESCLTE